MKYFFFYILFTNFKNRGIYTAVGLNQRITFLNHNPLFHRILYIILTIANPLPPPTNKTHSVLTLSFTTSEHQPLEEFPFSRWQPEMGRRKQMESSTCGGKGLNLIRWERSGRSSLINASNLQKPERGLCMTRILNGLWDCRPWF